MKLLTLALLLTSMSSFAKNHTCSKGTTLGYQCITEDKIQYDFCKQKDLPLYVIKVNGEEYSTVAERDDMEKTIQIVGQNYLDESFTATINKEGSKKKDLDADISVYVNDRLSELTKLKCSII